ncbi:hypothetical protein ACFO9E_30010 [Streptomyces maoxianensis]|uniref:Uncharacterized protein n=1 Tax=Streptomyces maoxianensis TaxID=1459942 RepID=A0ABV9GFM2_9ACTN
MAVILAMIAIGVFLIHQVNTQHEQRIATFRYGEAVQGLGRRRRPRRHRPATRPAGPPEAGTHPDRHDGGRG